MIKAASVLLLVLLAVSVSAKCPTVNVASPFDISQYLGIWYEISTTPTSLDTFERDCYCTRANYTLMTDGDVSVKNSCNIGGITGPVNIANGTAIIPDPTEPAKIKVTFGGDFYAPYWVIINDDYENAVVWSCTSLLGVGQVDYMWVLSRQNTMPTATYQQLTSQAASMTGYDVSKLIPTVQAGCTYPLSE